MTPGARKVEEAVVLAQAGRVGEARRVLEQYLRVRPADAEARLGLARVLAASAARADREASLAQFAAAASAMADPHEALFHHGQALIAMDRGLEAAQLGDDALARYPNDPLFLLVRGQARLTCGLSTQALADLDAARVLGTEDALRAYANATLYASGVSAEAQRDAFMALGRGIEAGVMAGADAEPMVARARDAGPLRVALVSPDFREHPVGWFIEAKLRHVDPARMRVTLLHAAPIRDGATARLEALASALVDVSAMSDGELAAEARRLGIDVAIDLAGHSHGSRLAAFARRLAPTQGTYLGHPVTTGMSCVDFRLVDAVTDPAGSDALCVERLIRLDPVFIAFAPAGDVPGIVARDASRPITFGSFNAITKLSDACVALWSRVLEAAPDSRLLLKSATLAEPALRERTRARFERHGVNPARIEVMSPTPTPREHLEAYARVDVALDTLPYNGTTTTCEALWMGVPVVTLAGDRHASRVGASLLSAAGLGDLVARDEEEFVRVAAGLSRDGARRKAWREGDGLRAHVARSAMCDARGLAERFMGAIESLAAQGGGYA